jgi:Holliday junction resolvase RusA-like endonuclease
MSARRRKRTPALVVPTGEATQAQVYIPNAPPRESGEVYIPNRVMLSLPVPPSANRWWRRSGARMHISPEAREYKEMVALKCAGVTPLEGEVRVLIRWYRAQKSGDLDKRIGVLLDALQGTAYANDKDVAAIHAERHEDKDNPRVEVVVTRYTERAA